jgi:hypothetical protein
MRFLDDMAYLFGYPTVVVMLAVTGVLLMVAAFAFGYYVNRWFA